MSDLLTALGDWLSDKFKGHRTLSRLITVLAFAVVAALIFRDLVGSGAEQ